MSQDLQILGFTLPAGYDPVTWQRLVNTLASGLVARFPGTFLGINDGNGTPLPENRDKPWNYRNGTTGVGRIYNWSNVYSLWIAEYHPVFSTFERMVWTGTEAQLQTHDEGVNEPIDDTHGPFWEADHEFDFRLAMGAGTSPAPASTVLAVAQNLGSETHTILIAELPSPLGNVAVKRRTDLQDGGGSSAFTDTGSNIGAAQDLPAVNSSVTPSPLAQLPLSLTPRVRGVFFARRSARLYYTRPG